MPFEEVSRKEIIISRLKRVFLPLFLIILFSGAVYLFNNPRIIIQITNPNKNSIYSFRTIVATMPTYLLVETVSPEEGKRLFNDATGIITTYDAVFSTHRADSDLSQLNTPSKRALWFDSSSNSEYKKELEIVIDYAQSYYERTDGAFNITVKPLLDLWDVGGERRRLPSQAEIQEAKSHISYSKDIFTKGRSDLISPDIKIDLGGISKGYIIDKVIEHLEKEGVENALFDIGGDMTAIGMMPEKDFFNTIYRQWGIGIKNPRPEKIAYPSEAYRQHGSMAFIQISNCSVVTSGDYERFLIDSKDNPILDASGNYYHHIIDPQTGFPSTHFISVTVIAKTAMQADVLSTGLFGMSHARAFSLIDSLEEVEAYFVYQEGDQFKVKMSSGFDKYLLVEDDATGG